MIPIVKRRIRDLVDSASHSVKDQAPERVWNLNLDQIESSTGKVIERIIVDRSKLGPSVVRFDAQTVLYSKLRPYLNKVVLADRSGYATTELVPLRCNESFVCPEFLAHYLRSPKFVEFASATVAGAKMPRMVMSEFWDHEVLIPPLPDQRRIAKILDKAEALRAKRRAALSKLDTLAQSIFLDMFGDADHNPKGWDAKKVCEFCITGSGGTPSRSRLEYFEDGSIPWIKSGELNGGWIIEAEECITEKAIKETSAKLIAKNSILIAMYGATIGKMALLGISAASNQAICHILPNSEANLIYLYSAISQRVPDLIKMGCGGAQPNINQGMIKELVILLPPLPLQQAFAHRIETIEALKERHRTSLAKLDALFASLQHRAFRGEL